MDRVPGRDTRSATSRQRQTSYGWGKRTLKETDALGCLLHDAAYVLGDVSVAALPVLLYTTVMTEIGHFNAGSAMFVAWLATVAVGAVIRGGWVLPLATEVPGWVSMTPALFAVRIVYFNCALAAAAFGGAALATAVGVPPASMVLAVLVAAVATMLFPAVAEAFYRRYGR